MKEKLKNCKGSLLGILYVVLCVCSMMFFYVASGNEYYFMGINGYQMFALNEVGALAFFLQMFQALFMFGLIALAMLFVTIILRAFGVIKFEITFKKLKETSVVKLLMIYQLVCALLVWLFALLIIVTNEGLAFGAGTFILLFVCIAGYVVQVLFFGKDVEKVEEEEQQQGDLEQQQDDLEQQLEEIEQPQQEDVETKNETVTMED